MANTRKDHATLLRTLGIEPTLVLVNTPNKVAKRMRCKFKKKHSSNTWDMLRMFHPKLFIDAMRKMNGRR